MGVIRKLSPELINQIAAGEVIERPASALKEIVENAIDAGATRVEVALEDGGRRLIRVVDDGAGIGADDLPLAVASHATSKLGVLDDLFRVRTLGFRGEALASIGSIAELRIASRPAGGDGHEIEVRGGAAGDVRPAGVARGTTVEVRNLFFNTPARRKFLRDGAGEHRLCVEALQRLALATPHVAFRAEHEGRLVFETPAATGLDRADRGSLAAARLARIADLFGRDLADDLVPVEGRRGAFALGGFVALPRRTRADSTWQHVTLDGRAIRDKLVAGALKEAYQGFLMTRRHPVVFIDLSAEPEAVDVNVHPAKLEVRFREPREVFGLVVRAIRDALEDARVDPVLQGRASGFGPQAPGGTSDAWTRGERGREASATGIAGIRRPSLEEALAATSLAEPEAVWRTGASAQPAMAGIAHPELRKEDALPRPELDIFGGVPWGGQAPASPATSFVPVPVPGPSFPPAPAPVPARHLQLASGYLLVETVAGFEVLDPHALHERILYEELRERIAVGAVEVQSLLIPAIVDLSPLEEARLEEARPGLAAIGLCVEPFGPRTAAIQAVPAILTRVKDWGRLLRDLLGASEESGQPSRAALVEHLTATMACKAAVKLGERLKPDEVAALLERRASAERSHLCPHGRPTALAFPASELERQFKR